MPAPLVFTRDGARRVDHAALHDYDIPGVVLMENAARGVAEVALTMLGDARGGVLIVCGGGNNAGDGFAAARHLHNAGAAVQTIRLRAPGGYTGDGATNLRIIEKMGLPIDGGERVEQRIDRPALVIDALLGTGATGAAREPIAGAIEWINALGAPVLAVDIPSGMDCDTGETPGACVRATRTATMCGWKRGFLDPGARRWTGEIDIIDIGAPREALRRFACAPGA